MNAIDATGPYRRPCGTNEIRPAVILQPSSPRPRSRAPRQSTPRTVADAPATLQEVALAIAACPAVPDQNVADPPSHHPPSRCCDNQLNPPVTPGGIGDDTVINLGSFGPNIDLTISDGFGTFAFGGAVPE